MQKILTLLLFAAVSLFGESFMRFEPPLAKPFGAHVLLTPREPVKMQPEEGSYSRPFEQLAKAYANTPVEHAHLKAVTLAMMMLESGRGGSDLARKHYNFGGLKYRPEMSGYASKVRYNASDGIDHYCKFDSVESFIEGFWVFLDRSPYQGWRNRAQSERAFIEFIAPIYCPFNPNYAEHVLALVPEAKQLLERYMDDGFRVAMLK